MSKAQIIRNTNRRYLVNRNSDYEKKIDDILQDYYTKIK